MNTGEVDSLGTMKVKPFVDTQEIVFNVRAERDAQVSYELRDYIKYILLKKSYLMPNTSNIFPPSPSY